MAADPETSTVGGFGYLIRSIWTLTSQKLLTVGETWIFASRLLHWVRLHLCLHLLILTIMFMMVSMKIMLNVMTEFH